jgi:hypothetical protein
MYYHVAYMSELSLPYKYEKYNALPFLNETLIFLMLPVNLIQLYTSFSSLYSEAAIMQKMQSWRT